MKLDVKLDQSSDWAKLRVAIDVGKSLGPHLNRAVLAELAFLRKKVLEVFATEGPDGAKWQSLSPVTLAVRKFRGFKGSKILQVTRDLAGSISVVPIPEGGGFIGVARTKSRKDGKDPVNIAALQESGFTATIPFGPKQRRFLFAAMAAAGLRNEPPAGKTGARGVTTVQIRVPPRPFLSPVLERYGQPEQLAESIMSRVTGATKGAIGTTGSKPRG